MYSIIQSKMYKIHDLKRNVECYNKATSFRSRAPEPGDNTLASSCPGSSWTERIQTSLFLELHIWFSLSGRHEPSHRCATSTTYSSTLQRSALHTDPNIYLNLATTVPLNLSTVQAATVNIYRYSLKSSINRRPLRPRGFKYTFEIRSRSTLVGGHELRESRGRERSKANRISCLQNARRNLLRKTSTPPRRTRHDITFERFFP